MASEHTPEHTGTSSERDDVVELVERLVADIARATGRNEAFVRTSYGIPPHANGARLWVDAAFQHAGRP